MKSFPCILNFQAKFSHHDFRIMRFWTVGVCKSIRTFIPVLGLNFFCYRYECAVLFWGGRGEDERKKILLSFFFCSLGIKTMFVAKNSMELAKNGKENATIKFQLVCMHSDQLRKWLKMVKQKPWLNFIWSDFIFVWFHCKLQTFLG